MIYNVCHSILKNLWAFLAQINPKKGKLKYFSLQSSVNGANANEKVCLPKPLSSKNRNLRISLSKLLPMPSAYLWQLIKHWPSHNVPYRLKKFLMVLMFISICCACPTLTKKVKYHRDAWKRLIHIEFYYKNVFDAAQSKWI